MWSWLDMIRIWYRNSSFLLFISWKFNVDFWMYRFCWLSCRLELHANEKCFFFLFKKNFVLRHCKIPTKKTENYPDSAKKKQFHTKFHVWYSNPISHTENQSNQMLSFQIVIQNGQLSLEWLTLSQLWTLLSLLFCLCSIQKKKIKNQIDQLQTNWKLELKKKIHVKGKRKPQFYWISLHYLGDRFDCMFWRSQDTETIFFSSFLIYTLVWKKNKKKLCYQYLVHTPLIYNRVLCFFVVVVIVFKQFFLLFLSVC